jgi:hypothetical protein
MEREAANAKWQRLHKDQQWHDGTWKHWSAEPSDEHPYHRDHGVTIGVADRDLRPDDCFLSQPSDEDYEEVDDGDTA